MQIQHPCDVATRTPIVITTDFLVDVEDKGRQTAVALAVKPAATLDKRRVLEKLELERRCCHEQGIEWGLVTEREIPHAAVRNISWIHRYRSLPHLMQPYPAHLDELTGVLLREIKKHPDMTLQRFCSQMDRRFCLNSGDILALFRNLLARRVLTFPVDELIEKGPALRKFEITGMPRPEDWQ